MEKTRAQKALENYGRKLKKDRERAATEEQPADLSEARRMAARKAASGEAGSMGVPKALREMLDKQNTESAIANASTDEIVAAIDNMSPKDFERLCLAVAIRRAEDSMGVASDNTTQAEADRREAKRMAESEAEAGRSIADDRAKYLSPTNPTR